MISVVIPYTHHLANGEQSKNGMCELRWALRSFCKHAKFKFNVVLVGDRPDWYQGDYIKTEEISGKRYKKAFDIARKLKAVYESNIISSDFIYSYDDIYLVNDCKISDFKKVIALGVCDRKSILKDGSTPYREIFENTKRALNLNTYYHYETHLPRVLNKERLRLIYESYSLHNRPLLFSTLYYNEFFDKPEIDLSKENNVKAAIYSKLSFDSICKEAEGKLWMNNSENAYCDALRKFLTERFLDKCKYEI